MHAVWVHLEGWSQGLPRTYGALEMSPMLATLDAGWERVRGKTNMGTRVGLPESDAKSGARVVCGVAPKHGLCTGVLPSNCSGTALGLRWYCTCTILVLHGCYTRSAPMLHWYCTGTPRVLHSCRTGSALEM